MDKIDYDKLFKHYLSKIKNLDVPNDKLYVTFSGITSSGKTTVARFLSKKMKGLYLSSDELRRAVLELWPEVSKENLQKIVLEFGPTIQNRLINYPNKLHIVDTNIDTYYKEVFRKAKEVGLPLYIIRIDVPKDELIRRIDNRKKNFPSAEELIRKLDSRLSQHKDFLKRNRKYINYFMTSVSRKSLGKLLVDIKKHVTRST